MTDVLSRCGFLICGPSRKSWTKRPKSGQPRGCLSETLTKAKSWALHLFLNHLEASVTHCDTHTHNYVWAWLPGCNILTKRSTSNHGHNAHLHHTRAPSATLQCTKAVFDLKSHEMSRDLDGFGQSDVSLCLSLSLSAALTVSFKFGGPAWMARRKHNSTH